MCECNRNRSSRPRTAVVLVLMFWETAILLNISYSLNRVVTFGDGDQFDGHINGGLVRSWELPVFLTFI